MLKLISMISFSQYFFQKSNIWRLVLTCCNSLFQYTPNGIRLKIFVKETEATNPQEELNTKKYFPIAPLTGERAKEFYEDIIKETTSHKEPIVKPKPKPPAKPVQTKVFKNSDLLWMAQNNDVRNLKVFLSQEKEFDINIVDDFGWTPLMCASCSGAEEVVELLLEHDANPYISDKCGNTALKLASLKNQYKIIEKLENYKKEPEIAEGEKSTQESVESFLCLTCKENFKMKKCTHESSTIHLFNSQLKTTTFYGIPECNKGFQLLLREGWDKEKGLGPRGTGRKFPVKAVVKKDRLGIGAPPPVVKNKRESQHTEKYESKKRKAFKKWKEKDFEKNFRLEFS